jgi:hypothetical protein
LSGGTVAVVVDDIVLVALVALAFIIVFTLIWR